jgi:hypothetical protein
MHLDIGALAVVCHGQQVGGLCTAYCRFFADYSERMCPLPGQVLLIDFFTPVFCCAKQFRRLGAQIYRVQCQVG